jgi:hypothetical protein
MKPNKGILIFLLSIVLTTIGSILKVMHVEVLPDVFLGLGMVAFIIAMVIILKGLLRRQNS